MRRIFLLALVLGIGCVGSNAQTWYETTIDGDTYRNGNVGIGIDVPEEKLHVGGGMIMVGNALYQGFASFETSS